MDLAIQFDGSFTPATVNLGPEAVITTSGKPNASTTDWHLPLQVQVQLANEDTVIDDIMASADEDVLLIFGENGGDNHFKCFLKNEGHYKILGQARPEDFYAIINGYDGIELLKRKGFVPESQFTSYTKNGVGTVREVLFYILNQLGLSLPFATSSNFYPVGGGAATVDPLGAILIDVGALQDRLYEENGTASSYEILKAICQTPSLNLRIRQVPTYGWLIEQRSMKFDSTQKLWTYSAAGSYTGTDPTTDAIAAISYDDNNLQQLGSGAYRLRPTYRTARVKYAHGVASRLLTPNGNFSEFDPATPEFPNWTATGFTPTPGTIGNGQAGATPIYPLLWDDSVAEQPYEDAWGRDYALLDIGFITEFWSYTTPDKVGGHTDDEISFQARCGCRLIRDEVNDIPQYDQFWTAYSILRVTDSKYLDDDGEFASATEVRIPLLVDGDGIASFNRTFAADTEYSKYTVKFYRLVDPVPVSFTQSDDYVGRNVQGFAWDEFVVKFIPAGTPENSATYTLASVPTESPNADDNQLFNTTTYIGTGPDDFNPSRLMLESDESTIATFKLDNGTADGSEVKLEVLSCRDALRQVVTPQAVYEFELVADTTPIEAWRHLTIGSFNYDLMYFTRKYRTGRCKGQYVQVRYDTWDGGEIVTVIPDTSGTYIPPNDKRPSTIPILGNVVTFPIWQPTSRDYTFVVTWWSDRAVASVKYEANLTDTNPANWDSVTDYDNRSTLPITGGVFALTGMVPESIYYLFIKPYNDTAGTGLDGLPKRVVLQVPPAQEGTVDGSGPPSCLPTSGKVAIYTMVGAGTTIINSIRNVAVLPDGAIIPDNTSLDYNVVEGLVKTGTSTTYYGLLPADALGSETLTRFLWAGLSRRNGAGDMTLLRINAGTSTQFDVILQVASGNLRIATTDDAATATENVDSTLLTLDGEEFVWGIAVEIPTS